MANYDFTILNVEDSQSHKILSTEWADVNNKGAMVGTCWGASPITATYFDETNENQITTFTIGRQETNGFGLNDNGVLVGRYVRAPTPGIVGFFRGNINQPTITTVIADGSQTELHGIDSAGTAIGRYLVPSAFPPRYQFFLWQNEHVVPVGGQFVGEIRSCAVNDQGDIVGGYQKDDVSRAFIWKRGVLHDLTIPNSTQSCAYGINNQGHIVGSYLFDDNSGHGFVLEGDNVNTVDFPDASGTVICGINDAGTIVGSYMTKSSPGPNGFIGKPTRRMGRHRILTLQARHFDLAAEDEKR